MPFSLFRRKKQDHAETPREEVTAPPPAPAPVVPDLAPAPGAAGDAEAKPKRRRGSRGGRGRKKPGERAAAAESNTEGKPSTQASADKPAKQGDRPARQRRAPAKRRQPARRPPLPAAKRELLVSVGVAEQRVAVLEDDRVAEVYLERPERRSIAGNIYKGTVDNVLPGMEAAFVEIGLEKNGFLYVDEIVGPELEGKRPSRRIQDLISRGQEVLVQAVKDPMKSKGARLTTEISLPGRFVVLVPYGEGLGVSRRLEDEERARLRDIVKSLDPPTGGVIIRTAAEGASAEDIERDLVFLQRLWRSIAARAKQANAPSLIYQEAELPLRVVRDLFTDDFARALVDHDRTYKRIVGYLKKTSPHVVERVVRYKEKEPLFDASGVEGEIRSTLSRRVDLPSGGYLVFDYAEAFTVIDVNTGRFVGSRSKGSGARLEDTITKNNLEAVKEVVRQLRLRDIGGIIVIDFIDMANPKNRELVEEALKTELERDRTKTYVVEISPLGLVEMTRQNVTDGPREILTKRCPACNGDGIVLSEASVAVDAERRLRELVAESRSPAFRIELNARVVPLVVGPGGERLAEIEAQARRRFVVEGRQGVALDHFAVTAQGKLSDIAAEPHQAEGSELEVKLVEVGLHDAAAGVAKLDGLDVYVAGAAKLVGKKVKVRIGRILDGIAYATLAGQVVPQPPLTAEAEAEKPTRAPRARKAAAGQEGATEEVSAEEVEALEADAEEDDALEPVPEGEELSSGEEKPKRKTRRGSRGGRSRKKKPVAGEAATSADASEPPPGEESHVEGSVPKIHVPLPELGREADQDNPMDVTEADTGSAAASKNGDDPVTPRKRTRRGTRGGRNRRKKPLATLGEANGGGAEAEADAGPDTDEAVEPEVVAEAAPDGGSGYTPMSEWIDEVVTAEEN